MSHFQMPANSVAIDYFSGTEISPQNKVSEKILTVKFLACRLLLTPVIEKRQEGLLVTFGKYFVLKLNPNEKSNPNKIRH